MRGMRLKFMLGLYTWSSRIYAQVFKVNKSAWGISKDEFLMYAEGSLGRALGDFYKTKGFDVMPKLENHDVFHVLTGTDTRIEDEVAMQYLLLGNGKISLYLLAMIGIGSLVFPEFLNSYRESFRKGKSCMRFHHIEFKEFLDLPLEELQKQFSVKKYATI